MGRIYFDITDIVQFARRNPRVSGIQRVQWNIIRHLAMKYGSDRVRCVFSYEQDRTRSMWECDPAEIMLGDEFDAELLLIKLGLMTYRSYLPGRPMVKNYLRHRSPNNLVRALNKWDVYLSALLFPKRLARMGLRRMTYRPPQQRNARRTVFGGLQRDDSFVLLGAQWENPQVLEFARRHKAQGGDVVQMVYDLIPHKFPQFVTSELIEFFASWLANIKSTATRFICISECSARDLREFLGPGREWDVTPIPLAHEFMGFDRQARVSPPSNRIAALVQQPFVLCVGTIEIRKNGAALLRAWQKLRQQLGARVPQLVFAGRLGWSMDEFVDALKTTPGLATIVEAPSDEELAALYQHCLFTVYPSLYEGWGLPVGESVWFGKYCIAAQSSSLPEVCGDLIDYCDPEDIDDMVMKIARALTAPDYVRAREATIREHHLRTWTDVAEDILCYLDHAAAGINEQTAAAIKCIPAKHPGSQISSTGAVHLSHS